MLFVEPVETREVRTGDEMDETLEVFMQDVRFVYTASYANIVNISTFLLYASLLNLSHKSCIYTHIHIRTHINTDGHIHI